MEQVGQQKTEHRTYQIFPEPSEEEEEEQTQGGAGRMKERLPSIVLERTDEDEGEEPQWPPQTHDCMDEEDELFQDQCDPDHKNQVHYFNCSSGRGAGEQIDRTRLTPPPSPSSSDEAPPCFRSESKQISGKQQHVTGALY